MTQANEPALISEKPRQKFRKFGQSAGSAYEELWGGVRDALAELDADWWNAPRPRKERLLRMVKLVAEHELKLGENASAVSTGTFNRYFSEVKTALLFNVSLAAARKANRAMLIKARELAEKGEVPGDTPEQRLENAAWQVINSLEAVVGKRAPRRDKKAASSSESRLPSAEDVAGGEQFARQVLAAVVDCCTQPGAKELLGQDGPLARYLSLILQQIRIALGDGITKAA